MLKAYYLIPIATLIALIIWWDDWRIGFFLVFPLSVVIAAVWAGWKNGHMGGEI